MARKTQAKKTFSEKLSLYANNLLNESQKVRVAKQTYLLENKEDIIKTYHLGYPIVLIAEYATKELLETGVAQTFEAINQDGDSLVVETKINPSDIKSICEQ